MQRGTWTRTHNSWTGLVSDTQCQADSSMFKIQNQFAEKDTLPNDAKLPFTNVFVKGYRNRLAAWQEGEQLTFQPTFASSDRKFRRDETLSSAVIASDRRSNERAVRLAKMAGHLNRGLHRRQSIKRMHHAWLCWGFQVNLMFGGVL